MKIFWPGRAYRSILRVAMGINVWLSSCKRPNEGVTIRNTAQARGSSRATHGDLGFWRCKGFGFMANRRLGKPATGQWPLSLFGLLPELVEWHATSCLESTGLRPGALWWLSRGSPLYVLNTQVVLVWACRYSRVCIHTHMPVYIKICASAYVYLHLSISLHLYLCVYIYIYVHRQREGHKHTCIYTYAYIYNIYIHSYTYILYTYIERERETERERGILRERERERDPLRPKLDPLPGVRAPSRTRWRTPSPPSGRRKLKAELQAHRFWEPLVEDTGGSQTSGLKCIP